MAAYKKHIDLEIERHIAERDKLLLRAQRSSRPTPASNEIVPSSELMALVQRIAHLELALSRYLDKKWLRSASTEELLLNAREALEPGEDDEVN